MRRFVIDSFAWMEFFKGTSRGKKVKDIIEDERIQKYTTAANYYEIYYRIFQEKGQSIKDEAISFIKANSKLVDITEEIASIAAEIRIDEGLSAIDSFTLAAARLIKAKVLTGDKDFSKIKDVEMI